MVANKREESDEHQPCDSFPHFSTSSILISFFKYGLHACTQCSSFGLSNDCYYYYITINHFRNVLITALPVTLFVFLESKSYTFCFPQLSSVVTPEYARSQKVSQAEHLWTVTVEILIGWMPLLLPSQQSQYQSTHK